MMKSHRQVGRRVSTGIAVALVPLLATAMPFAAQAAGDEYTMPLDQTILVWEDVNYDNYPDGSNWDVEMSTVSTLTGDAAVIGYSQQPAIPEGPCPAPWEDLTLELGDLQLCGGGTLKSASIHPTTRELFALIAGADSPNSLLYTVNPSTAEPTLEAVLTLNDGYAPFNVRNIFFTADGSLYATWYEPGQLPENAALTVYLVDVATGVMSVAHTIDLSPMSGQFSSLIVDADGTAWLFASQTNQDGRASFIYTVDFDTDSIDLAFTLDDLTVRGGSFDRQGVLWAHAESGAPAPDEVTSLLTIAATECNEQATNCVTERADLDITGGFVVTDVPLAAVAGVQENSQLRTGSTVGVSLSGARAGSSYTVELFSDPVLLAEGAVSRLGSATSSFTIPTSVPPGPHTLVITYAAPNGLPVVEEIPVLVARGELSATGLDAHVLSAFGIAALITLVGAGILLARRSVRNPTALS